LYFLYVDESGKSGLDDPQQPFFVLGGLAMHESIWAVMESDLNARIDALVPPPRPHRWELHMADMAYGKGWFKGMSRDTREALCEAVLDTIDAHEPTFIFVAIDKAKLKLRYPRPDAPEDLAYRFIIERFDNYLARRDAIGLIVSDDQKGGEDTIRKAHSRYRSKGTDYQRIDHVVETPFFAPSHWSRMLQVIDVATWLCNRTLRARASGGKLAEPTEWERIEPRLDLYPAYAGRGLKVFPEK
jgi:hypothetical protein